MFLQGFSWACSARTGMRRPLESQSRSAVTRATGNVVLAHACWLMRQRIRWRPVPAVPPVLITAVGAADLRLLSSFFVSKCTTPRPRAPCVGCSSPPRLLCLGIADRRRPLAAACHESDSLKGGQHKRGSAISGPAGKVPLMWRYRCGRPVRRGMSFFSRNGGTQGAALFAPRAPPCGLASGFVLHQCREAPPRLAAHGRALCWSIPSQVRSIGGNTPGRDARNGRPDLDGEAAETRAPVEPPTHVVQGRCGQ